jgi:acyl-CoA reductase-like NAD-dependent aldehyde dehydrogenase
MSPSRSIQSSDDGPSERTGQRTYDVVSPATGEWIASHSRMTLHDVERAVASAAAAYQANRNRTSFQRADWCHAVANLVDARGLELARLLTLEHGKPLSQATAEVHSAATGFRLAAEESVRLAGETLPVRDPSKLVLTTRQPCGVFAVITPFNFPVNIPVEYLGPMIAAGNAVVWKPSPSTTTIAAALFDCIRDGGVPDGLVNLVTGPDVEPFQALVSHPDVIGVGFTGGSKSGGQIARLAAGKAQLMELGGNGPIVVLGHADIEQAATASASAAFWNSGQSCAAAGRILVSDSAYDGFVEALTMAATHERLGDPFDLDTTMGPVHTHGIASTMRSHLDDATRRGGRLVTGGCPSSEFPTELYWPPTIVADVPDDIESVLAAANSGVFGLSGAVFGTELDETVAVASRLRTGTVIVNDSSNYWELHLPFGGAAGRQSGLGRIGGRHTFEMITQVHTVSLTLASDWRS